MWGKPKSKEHGASPDTIVGPDSNWEGRLKSDGSVFINGSLKGEVEVAGKMVVGPKGRLEARVDAGSAAISGQVVGDMFLRELLEVNSTGKILGEIHSDMVAVAEGGVVDGQFKMGPRVEEAGEVKETGEEKEAETDKDST